MLHQRAAHQDISFPRERRKDGRAAGTPAEAGAGSIAVRGASLLLAQACLSCGRIPGQCSSPHLKRQLSMPWAYPASQPSPLLQPVLGVWVPEQPRCCSPRVCARGMHVHAPLRQELRHTALVPLHGRTPALAQGGRCHESWGHGRGWHRSLAGWPWRDHGTQPR